MGRHGEPQSSGPQLGCPSQLGQRHGVAGNDIGGHHCVGHDRGGQRSADGHGSRVRPGSSARRGHGRLPVVRPERRQLFRPAGVPITRCALPRRRRPGGIGGVHTIGRWDLRLAGDILRRRQQPRGSRALQRPCRSSSGQSANDDNDNHHAADYDDHTAGDDNHTAGDDNHSAADRRCLNDNDDDDPAVRSRRHCAVAGNGNTDDECGTARNRPQRRWCSPDLGQSPTPSYRGVTPEREIGESNRGVTSGVSWTRATRKRSPQRARR